MAGMIPGVGVPHRRRIHSRVNSEHSSESYLKGDRSDIESSSDLGETALRARQRLQKKLGSCLHISPRLNGISSKSNGHGDNGSSSSKFANIKKSLKLTSTKQFDRSDRNLGPFCC